MHSNPRFKHLLLVIPLAGMSFFLGGCELGYVLRQGIHQIQLLARRVPVEDVLADPSTPSDIKERIRLVQRVRRFGETHLDLRASGAYESYIEMQGDVVAFVVSASHKTRLEPYLWRFPLVGHFPYKGFFKRREAQEEERSLAQGGYDTHLSGAAAFSALGLFSDPLYSSMLRMEQADLLYTILHEMVHGTVFFPNEMEFNEQLATFVGWRGIIAFLEEAHGKDAPEVQRVWRIIEDEKRFSGFLVWAHERMDAFYRSSLTDQEKVDQRENLFREIRSSFLTLLQTFHTSRFSGLAGLRWNNASLLALWRYRFNTGSLEALLESLDGDLRGLIRLVTAWRERGVDPWQAVEEHLKIRSPGQGDLGRQPNAPRGI